MCILIERPPGGLVCVPRCSFFQGVELGGLRFLMNNMCIVYSTLCASSTHVLPPSWKKSSVTTQIDLASNEHDTEVIGPSRWSMAHAQVRSAAASPAEERGPSGQTVTGKRFGSPLEDEIDGRGRRSFC